MSETPADAEVLERVYGGTAKIAQKLGEEAVEALIAALAQDKAALVAESADLLYHLLVLWADRGVVPAQVWAELELREKSGVLKPKHQDIA